MAVTIPQLRTICLASLLGIGNVSLAQVPLGPPAAEVVTLPVTFRLLQERLLKKEREESLLTLIEIAPYVFRPTDEQLDELTAAGASPKLLAAVKAAANDVSKADESGLAPFDRQLIKQLGDKSVMVRARAAQALGRRNVVAAAPALAALIASEMWETGASLPVAGDEEQLEYYLYTDASKTLALDNLLVYDRLAAERALLKAMESPEPRVRKWATDILTKLISERATPEKATE